MNINDLLEIAKKEVGTREEGGNNKGKRIKDYQSATWLNPGPWPWCAAFVCWCYAQWVKDDKTLTNKRCRDASAFGWEKWAKANGHEVLPEFTLAKAGDIMIFDFSHIGFVIEDQIGEMVETIEGNTNGRGERESDSGDGVWIKSRHFQLAKCYIRIKV